MANDNRRWRRLLQAVLLTLPILLLMAMMTTQGRPLPQSHMELIPLAVAYVTTVGVFFLIVYTGRTHKFRSALFVAYAVCFVLTFIPNLIETRGSMSISRAEMIQGHTPFCHMVIPTTLIPAALSRTIIFPGSMLEGFASIGTMLVLWLGVTIALGRGWCSWGCFYGGLDEGFSKIGRKPLLRRINPRWTYLPFAVLLAIALTSAATLTPTYCAWLCPFKAVTEFEAVTSATVLVQTVIFVSLFVGLVIVLPLLTKRRTQCGLFCPMGAFQSLTNKLNIFDVRIDPNKCVQCGRCIDACPKGAMSYHIKGTPVGVQSQVARMMFVYPAYLLLAILGSGMIIQATHRLLLLVTTGRMIQ
jgi:ferredoxin